MNVVHYTANRPVCQAFPCSPGPTSPGTGRGRFSDEAGNAAPPGRRGRCSFSGPQGGAVLSRPTLRGRRLHSAFRLASFLDDQAPLPRRAGGFPARKHTKDPKPSGSGSFLHGPKRPFCTESTQKKSARLLPAMGLKRRIFHAVSKTDCSCRSCGITREPSRTVRCPRNRRQRRPAPGSSNRCYRL